MQDFSLPQLPEILDNCDAYSEGLIEWVKSVRALPGSPASLFVGDCDKEWCSLAEHGLGYARLYLFGAIDHFRSAGVCLVDGGQLGVETLARCAIEAAAGSYAITRMDIDSSQRRKRVAIDVVYANRQMKNLPFLSDEQKSDHERRITRTVELAEPIFGNKRPAQISQLRNSVNDCDALFDAMESDDGESLYRAFSSVSHTNPEMVLLRSEAQRFNLSDGDLIRAIWQVARGLVVASVEFAEFNGEDLPQINQMVESIRSMISDALVGESSPELELKQATRPPQGGR